MDLTGKLIKGTGSFEVGEITPPVESGQLLTNPYFSTDLSGWSFPDGGWTWVGGKAVGQNIGVGGRAYQVQLTSGRTYKLRVKVDAITGTFNCHLSELGIDDLIITSTGVHEVIKKANNTYAGMSFTGAGATATVDWITVEEVPEGYPLLDKGTKYLECTASGTVAIPSNVAYGEWEFDVYKRDDASQDYVRFISTKPLVTNVQDVGYIRFISNNEAPWLRRSNGGSAVALFTTANGTVSNGVWYRYKVTRTLDGEFYAYIKGGSFGTDDWTLLTASAGSNPATNNIYQESKYFSLDIVTGDRIANIEIRNLVRQ